MIKYLSVSLLLAGVAATIPAVAAKPPKNLAATGTFRCDAGLPGEPCPGAGTDRVRDDGQGTYDFLLSSGEGSQINDVGEYYLWMQSGGQPRSFVVDLSSQVEGADCDGNCYYQQAWGTLPTINVADGWLRTNVLAGDGVSELNGGLLALPCNETRDSRLLITFTNATKTVSSSLRWYADAFSPSNDVKVTRHSRTAFTIEAPDGEAQAVLMGSALNRQGKLSGTRQEGVFDMPFKLQVSVPGAPAKAGCAG